MRMNEASPTLQAALEATGPTANRVTALACTLHLNPDTVNKGLSGATGIADQSRKLEAWLNEASTGEDAALRRTLLVMTCDQASESTPADRIRDFVKQLHRRAISR